MRWILHFLVIFLLFVGVVSCTLSLQGFNARDMDRQAAACRARGLEPRPYAFGIICVEPGSYQQ
jgi:hypothetical protein